MATTLTVEEILQDVIDSFKNKVPGIKSMSTDFRTDSLKLNKEYTAHIVGIPGVTQYDAGSGGYQANATDVRTLLEDVPVTVDKHSKVSLSATHINSIQDDKQAYEKAIANMGYSLAKDFTNEVVAKFNSRTISQSSTFATGDSDYDAIENIRSDMNLVAASQFGRAGIVNTPVASALHLDTRILDADFRGEMDGANAHRVFRNICGFESVMEWPDMPTNNGTPIAVTIAASNEVVTSASAHGLLVGDRVTFPTLTGGTGLTAGSTIYHVVSVPTATTLTVSATAGGSAVDVTENATAGTIAKAENLTGMFWEPRAISVLAGIPDDLDGAAQQFGAPSTYGITTLTDPDTGLTFAAIAESQQGTLKGFLHITHVYGVSVGKQAITATAGDLTDYAGHRLISA